MDCYRAVPIVFRRLNDGWNAEPNAPNPIVSVEASTVQLQFVLNSYAYSGNIDELARLRFVDCSAWRLGSTNDEGWYLGQCRYSRLAPSWGEFYELIGEDPLRDLPTDWYQPNPMGTGIRHFLFYLRDETFECFASDWVFERSVAGS